MEFSLEAVQDLAPDQASLNAAKKLLKPGKWPVLGQSKTVTSIWGQCQGSGSNPYLTMADVVDRGYKCTCPSRKFPCKHVLALLWQFADRPDDFGEGEPPEWVHEWLGRRKKKSTNSDTEPAKSIRGASIARAVEPQTPELSAEEQAKKDLARQRRAEKTRAETDAQIAEGLVELQRWVCDQLRVGIGALLKEVSSKCRQIAARLVDAKAINLASRLDELPAQALSLESQRQASFVMKELGQLVLLAEAWLANREDADARRGVGATEPKDQLIEAEGATPVAGVWQKVGEKIQTRRDGLISHESWFLKLDNKPGEAPVFAQLLDFYPASAGRRESAGGIGQCLQADLLFYPSRVPLRALPIQQSILSESQLEWPPGQQSVAKALTSALSTLPWIRQLPCLLGAGRVLGDGEGRYWWRDAFQTIPLANQELMPLILGSQLTGAVVLWNGHQGELLSVLANPWGMLQC